jgi:hypothetical protein
MSLFRRAGADGQLGLCEALNRELSSARDADAAHSSGV